MSNISTVYEDEDMKVEVEEEGGFLFLHCHADNFNKTVLKKMRDVFEEVKDACSFYGWEALHSYTPNPKFAKIFGECEVIDSFEKGGKYFEVIRWELKR